MKCIKSLSFKRCFENIPENGVAASRAAGVSRFAMVGGYEKATGTKNQEWLEVHHHITFSPWRNSVVYLPMEVRL